MQDERGETNPLPLNVNRSILSENDQVFVKDGERCWFVKLSDIRLFESVGNYAKVYFGPNKPLILKSLNALEERLDEKTFFPGQPQAYCQPPTDR
ncbi:LytTR family DNA-binding domain-containing protein [Paraflavitalea speifideaquila]|uniref:LytTR family DNA-binding domain-containing protein n=1 Tax=Paraflavitalea speifideaquila TaxID=3076558 RepID=UPI0028E548F1|nr:LytTR family DNA-binding domain-containing protein [Paraflavitalea speifideiaquila]